MKRPNFFIVGAPRCGTTAMYHYLKGHPEVFMPDVKEPEYFGVDLSFKRHPRVETEDDYLKLFDAANGEPRLGEASPLYLYSETAPLEIKRFCASAKIIIQLRNPVDMIYSLHSKLLLIGHETISDFAVALEVESERRRGQRVPAGIDFTQEVFYRWMGSHATHVERYLKVFGAENVHFVILDDIKSDPAKTYQGVLRFLGIDDSFVPDFRVVNENTQARIRLLSAPPYLVLKIAKMGVPKGVRQRMRRVTNRFNRVNRKRPAMDQALRRRLQRGFSPDIRRLGALIDRDLESWITDGGQKGAGARSAS